MQICACCLCIFDGERGRKVGEENGEGVEDTSAGPIFRRDSWNEVKNPPGGARCWRVMKNRCLFPLCFYAEGSALSCSGSSVCPSFVPPCSLSVCLALLLITLPCHRVSCNNLPRFFPSSLLSVFRPSNDNPSINNRAEKSFFKPASQELGFLPHLFGSVCVRLNISLFTFAVSATGAQPRYTLLPDWGEMGLPRRQFCFAVAPYMSRAGVTWD